MLDFEVKVLNGLKKCGIDLSKDCGFSIGAAVSGGADSVSLLVSLSNILEKYSIPLKVITINHNIRSEQETRGDALFVQKLCNHLADCGKKITCTIVELPKGAVDTAAKERGQGVEEAARYLRYKAFDSFIEKNKLSYLCLAHNRNDQLETVLMRFLQGASVDSASGIKYKREFFIRPLLEIERSEIETYLNENGFKWRNDSTNNQTEYLRNKIRLKLVPFLDKEFYGWKTGVISGAKKAGEDSELINELVEKFQIEKKDDEISISLSDFTKQSDALKKRILLKMFNLAGESKRIPMVFLEDVIFSLSDNSTKVFDGFCVQIKKNRILLKKDTKLHTEIVFFDIIEESGIFEFPFGVVKVTESFEEDAAIFINDTLCVSGVKLPFCIKSVQPGDCIETVSGEMKKVSDIFTDWHVSGEDKNLIPVVQLLGDSSQKIKCILGSFLGYKDWIVI